MTPPGATAPGREGGEIEALVTDRYLDSLLAAGPHLDGRAGSAELLADGPDGVGAAVRAVSRRLAMDLPRFHPSFRFEERLALRLAELAASMRLPLAAGGESQPIPLRASSPVGPSDRDGDRDGERVGELDDRAARPLLIGGAVAASAISLAGAWLAWRRRTTSPMARAARAAHARSGAGQGA